MGGPGRSGYLWPGGAMKTLNLVIIQVFLALNAFA